MSCASCSAERRGGWPFDQLSLSPSGVDGALRAGFNDLGELRQLLRREARRVAFRPAVLEPFGAAFIKAVHPVPQRLAVHATDPLGPGSSHPAPPQATADADFGSRAWRPPQDAALVGRKVRPHRHRCRHGTNPPGPWNQLNFEKGIANELERKAVGIRPDRPPTAPPAP